MDSFKMFEIDLTNAASVDTCAWLEPFDERDLDAAFDVLLAGAVPVSDASALLAPSEHDAEVAPLVGRR